MDLSLGKILYDVGDTVQFIYFPHSAVLSLLAVLSDGGTAEMATIGSEGVMGLTEALGDGVSQSRCIVQAPGEVSRIRVEHFRELMESDTHVHAMTLRYIQFLFTQILQVGACNAVHSVEARCCRMILTMRDRIDGDKIPLTHEFLAELIGVHRPAISLVAHRLQEAQLIKQGRGLITVTDGPRLEEHACECYGAMRRSLVRFALRSSDAI
jgi:CRP-like cAMP-binding protein